MHQKLLAALVLFLCLLGAPASAEPITYEQAIASVQGAITQQQKLLPLWRGEIEILRAALAKNPPGPGWANFAWSDSPVAADIYMLRTLLTFAKELDLYDIKTRDARLIFCSLAHRCEQVVAAYAPADEKLLPYVKRLEHMPEHARALELTDLHKPSDKLAWQTAAAFLNQQCGADSLEPDAWKHSLTETAPAFVRFKARIEQLRKEADAMARRYGARITVDWPSNLALLLEDVRARADLWSMALAADISENTSKEGLRTITDLFRINDDADKLIRHPFQNKVEGYPPFSPPERRFAWKVLRALDDYERAEDFDQHLAVGNKAEALLDAH